MDASDATKSIDDLLHEIEDVGATLPPLDDGAAGEATEKLRGWADETTLYLQEPILEQMKSATDAPLEEQQVLQLLEQARILLRGTERGCRQDRITIPGSRQRCRV